MKDYFPWVYNCNCRVRIKAASRGVQISGKHNARCKGSDYGGNGETGSGCTVAEVVYDFGVSVVTSRSQVNFTHL